MQPPRYLVSISAEFPTGVQFRHYCLECRDLGFWVNIYWDSSTVVGDAHFVVGQKCDLDVVCKATHGFVARVVEDFPNEMVQSGSACRTDVHTRAPAHSLQAFENGNILGLVRRTPRFGGSVESLFCLLFSHVLSLEYSTPLEILEAFFSTEIGLIE